MEIGPEDFKCGQQPDLPGQKPKLRQVSRYDPITLPIMLVTTIYNLERNSPWGARRLIRSKDLRKNMKSVHLTVGFFLLIPALLISGCSGGSGGGGDGSRVGQITPTGISGLTYETASQRGTTGDQGQYRFFTGERLALWVGDLQLASDVPVEPVVTPLEFFTAERELLKIAGTTDEGLQSHRITEQQLIEASDPLMNLGRLLLALNWQLSISEGAGVEIRERVIEQINTALPNLSEPIEFNIPRDEFAFDDEGILSPANQLLAEICFAPPEDELCQEPPTQEEIDNAPPRPEDPDDRDEDIEFREDLESRRDRILQAIRTIEDVDPGTVAIWLTRELDILSTDLGIRYFLDDFVKNIPASDTSIKTVRIRKIADEPDLADIEAISTNDQGVAVHSFSRQLATAEYFVAGESGDEAEILVNFKPSDTYRWVRKSLRVVVE